MNLIAFVTLILSIYVLLECISVAAAANGEERLCIVARYLTVACAGMYSAWSAGWHLISIVILPALDYFMWPRPMPLQNALFILAIALTCWSRMVYRLFGAVRIDEALD